ncbi:transcription antitermination protein NusB [Spiroplasma gladiatoris]|uniref:Transcription antitermination protein NusB n=1 Tax=Spiroplasma gladiatoris TaxID=2143 RepID=A0A4P7AIZ6_9MOLU|nr:transcription antitermination factor NusB [Spiroplasma gladiatoris]QBQ07703.1 transcription antitermination protein NusB [Spiroplasma gladiatoris]
MEKSITYLKKQRRSSVQILYKLSILNEDIDKIKQEVLDNSQFDKLDDDLINYILKILDQYETIKQSILKLIPNNWSWERLPNIIKAILSVSAFEIINNINPKAVVINEAIEMVREFLPSWDTNFINGLLDKIN